MPGSIKSRKTEPVTYVYAPEFKEPATWLYPAACVYVAPAACLYPAGYVYAVPAACVWMGVRDIEGGIEGTKGMGE
jgi:hypothetical protein